MHTKQDSKHTVCPQKSDPPKRLSLTSTNLHRTAHNFTCTSLDVF